MLPVIRVTVLTLVNNCLLYTSEIVKGKPLYFLMAASVQSYEEIMIRGLVTAKLKMPLAEKFVYIVEFLPYIDNWAVCDCLLYTSPKSCRWI